MGLIDVLISSIASAPGTGFGPVSSALGGTAGLIGSSPPTSNGPPLDAPPLDAPPPDAPPPDAPPPDVPLSWDVISQPTLDLPSDPIPPPNPFQHEAGTDSFFYPESEGRDFVTIELLDKYGDWISQGDSGTRAAKALTAIVVLPPMAFAIMAEKAIRTPFL